MKRLLLGKITRFIVPCVLALMALYTISFMKDALSQRNNNRLAVSEWDSVNVLVRDRNLLSKPDSQQDSLTDATMNSGSAWLASTSDNSSALHEFGYHGHDLLKDTPFTFDKRFKNPCWYEDNRLRCLPNFFVIGIKKSGTSEIFKKICLHPHVVLPGFKEAQFFARNRFKNGKDDINVYVDMFKNAAAHIQGKSKKQPLKFNPYITGEGSPSNLHLNTHWMHLPSNEHLSEPRVVILDYIKHFIPNAKLIITLRDPVERLYSDYYHEYGTLNKTNHPNPRDFHEIVSEGVELYKKCFERNTIRGCVFNPDIYSHTKVQMQLGIYYIFWEELLRVFPRKQILVVQNKDLSTIDTLRRCHSFLGLESVTDSQLEAMQAKIVSTGRRPQYKKEGPMFNSTFNLLYKFYKPFNEKMADLTQDATFLYSHDYA